jgi:uncharacterized protein with GYD domain
MRRADCAILFIHTTEQETTMALYMVQASFTSEAWAAQIQHSQNRAEQMRTLIEANGGRMIGYYYAFGEYDVILISELPDNVTAAALVLAAAGGGALKALKTTVLMSVEDGIAAMRKASGTGYRPPGN